MGSASNYENTTKFIDEFHEDFKKALWLDGFESEDQGLTVSDFTECVYYGVILDDGRNFIEENIIYDPQYGADIKYLSSVLDVPAADIKYRLHKIGLNYVDEE